MNPKDVIKLQSIADWELNKPDKDDVWAEDVKAESLDLKFDHQLQQMLDGHVSKRDVVQKDLDIFTNFPDVKRYEITEYLSKIFEDIDKDELGKRVDEEFDSQLLFYTLKVAKLDQSILRISKEIELRAKGYLTVNEIKLKGTLPKGSRIRMPIGTTYYVDPVNGTNTFLGTKITGTIDSTADSTHFVDAALTGADDYILNSYFYNETTGKGTLISDFVALTDTVTLTDADASMSAGDTYYILNAWLDLDQFTENARSAGDKVIIRRGANRCDDGTDLNFTSSGNVSTPIEISTDYDNEWHDKVDLSVTATATLTFGSVTVTFSADISGVLAANDWIYANGDSVKEFAYEVKTVSTNTVTLFLPYKGSQAGSGRTMYNISDNPIWGITTGGFQWNMDADNCWKVQGIDIRGSDSNGQLEIDSSLGQVVLDCIFQGNAASNLGFNFSDDYVYAVIRKSRTFNDRWGMQPVIDVFGMVSVYDSLLDQNSVANSRGINQTIGVNFMLSEVKIQNSALADLYGPQAGTKYLLRNTTLASGTEFTNQTTTNFSGFTYYEDGDGTPNNTQFFSGLLNTSYAVIFQSTTASPRSGGSNIYLTVTPTAQVGTNWELNYLLLFELPIYATTDSKTYTVYFNLPDANFTVDPTASELWIELEAWGHASNNYRKITKSTGTITSDGNWNSLSVTVAPAQAGVAYLRAYYAKTKEAGSNIFYVDPIPIVT